MAEAFNNAMTNRSLRAIKTASKRTPDGPALN